MRLKKERILASGAAVAATAGFFLSMSQRRISGPAATLDLAPAVAATGRKTFSKPARLPSAATEQASAEHAIASAPPTAPAAFTLQAPEVPPAALQAGSEFSPRTAGNSIPQFRAVFSDAEAFNVPQAVTLDFSLGSRMPAILASPSASLPAPTASQEKAEQEILQDFTTASAASEEMMTGNATDEDLTAHDERWEAAARAADEHYRIILGKAAYLQQSLEAAKLRLQQANPIK
ncbi:MAG: hypothetical protein EOP86_23325 [Verrucomicrobiaceae bacterium]|nr:MAG: hypothetical protein EOP86_23325 [Verrucomicrobiaceae bacterium]